MKRSSLGAMATLVCGLTLIAVGGAADASAGKPCKVVGQTKQIVDKHHQKTLVCVAIGSRNFWQTAQFVKKKYGATVLKGVGLSFIELAETVKDYQAQCVLVMSGDEVVAEWNFGKHKSETKVIVASISKSFTNTLVGIAQSKGLLNIDERASKYITEWLGTKSETVTIRHLLAMTSTRSDFNLAKALVDARGQAIFDLDGGAKHATSPGSKWSYSNASTQALEVVLSRATGETVTTFAQRELFSKLGMITTIERDQHGVEGLFAGFKSTCRDVASLVRLYLRYGDWDGTQIISREYVVDSLTPQVTSTATNASMNGSYGLQIWLNSDKGTALTVKRKGALYPNLPTDIFWFMGACHQFGVGVPSKDLTIVMLRPSCDTIDKAIWDQLNPAPAEAFVYQAGKAIVALP